MRSSLRLFDGNRDRRLLHGGMGIGGPQPDLVSAVTRQRQLFDEIHPAFLLIVRIAALASHAVFLPCLIFKGHVEQLVGMILLPPFRAELQQPTIGALFGTLELHTLRKKIRRDLEELTTWMD